MNFKILFVGTGVSTAVPNMRCIFNMNAGSLPPCAVCKNAHESPEGLNRRNNVAIAIIFENEAHQQRVIMIDAGKTMRDACLRLFPRNGISAVHALILTHGHADAIMGLDDLRDLQVSERVKIMDPQVNQEVFAFRILSGAIPVYLSEETMKTVESVFPYLTSPPRYLDKETKVIERRVACIELNPIRERSTLNVHGMPVECFPTYHGGTYVSLGFSIGTDGQFVYISDVKIIPEESWSFLKSLPRIKVFVLDCLDFDGIWSHVGLYEAIEICKQIDPEQVYFTGMSCGLGLHEEMEAELQTMGLLNYHLAYDGLVLEF